MAIIEYARGDHPAGFIGLRVTTSLGEDGFEHYQQKYFAFSQYQDDHEEARRQAQALNEKWRQQAEERKRYLKVSEQRPIPEDKKHIMAPGLRAEILVEKKKRGGELRAYFSPGFIVENIGYGTGHTRYRINKLGLIPAYVAAVSKYAFIHQLSRKQVMLLMQRMPDASLFTNELHAKLIRNGHQVSKEKIGEMVREQG